VDRLVGCRDPDRAGVDVGEPRYRVTDAVLDVRELRLIGPDGDLVADPMHTGEMPDRALGPLALIARSPRR
jgi:hypothetical protein